jgi:hypothetical protein
VPFSPVPTTATFVPVDANAPVAPLVGATKAMLVPASGPVTGQPFVFASATWKLD